MTYASPSSINASNGIGEILTYINEVTNNWASNMILIAVYIIFLMGYYRAKNDFIGGLAVSGFATFIIGLLFWLGGFINGWTFSFTIAILIIGVAVVFITKEN